MSETAIHVCIAMFGWFVGFLTCVAFPPSRR